MYINKKCPYYPCHELKEMLCGYCFCPLYHDNDCGGKYTILENGLKDCSKCLLPHTKSGIKYINCKL